LRSALLLPPLAALTCACALRPPSLPDGATTSAPAPAPVAFGPAPPADALRRWQLPPPDPSAPFAKYTLLASTGTARARLATADVASLESVHRAQAAARSVAAEGAGRRGAR
jgi:hypothetical protein